MVVPVRVESRVWTEDRALVTELMADSMKVTWVFMEVFSASVQVTVEGTSEISLASAEMSAVGFCETLVSCFLHSSSFSCLRHLSPLLLMRSPRTVPCPHPRSWQRPEPQLPEFQKVSPC